ncbi:MAG: excinuclease ABC subunit UvrA [Deltaproteobacteria bacterium]|nr:excinuclease ABC subunit UvrA [Deltaproteobacteria bacterium]
MSRRQNKHAEPCIRIQGARMHNLKNIHLELPRNKLIAICGLSGSGKSSLAFDTLYAEGQRRYVESLSAYARQFLDQMTKPDVDAIDGLSPAISIEQKSVSRNPRSTVGTVTEIYDYLRLLYARVGQPHCPQCDLPVSRQSAQEIVDQVMAWPKGWRFAVLAPVVRARKGEHRKLLKGLLKQGYTRVNVDGQLHDLDGDIELDPKRKHDVDVYVDRLVIKDGLRSRLTDSVETALGLAGGIIKLAPVDGDDIVFSERHACVACGLSLAELSPRLFSFNAPQGACPDCDGLGHIRYIHPGRVVPDESLSLSEGAVSTMGRAGTGYYGQMIEAVAKKMGFGLDIPFADLPEKARQVVLYGSGDRVFEFDLESERMSHKFKRPFEGAIPNLERRFRETTSEAMRAEIDSYMTMRQCETCEGQRLRPDALAVRIHEHSIAQISAMTVTQALDFFDKMDLDKQRATIAERILREIKTRLRFMADVGLNYLSLDRASMTLSGGESQRIRLATQIGSSLVGVLYVLDEPTIGLHPRDGERLLDTLRELRDRGNTVVVVEHDPATIRASDFVVDMGPGAGHLGGRVVATGSPDQIMNHPDSLTGAYLSGRKRIAVPKKRRVSKHAIKLKNARGNNLQGIDVTFPLAVFTCVTGVSGSGKSTLVIDTLYRGLAEKLYRSQEMPADHDGFSGLKHIDKVIHINQSPIGRTPRSNPATYTGVFTAIRDLYAKLPESRVRGWGPGRYSFNVKGGRCEACGGGGQIRIEMHFLPDMFVTCETCGGKRFNRETLDVQFRGRNIHQVLEMTVAEGLEFFAHQRSIQHKLQTLVDVGLGYIHIGQPATTLSGGEAQRIKLARELSKRATGRTFYILDEPTTGLHPEDISQLIEVLTRLVETGNTVVVIEHNLDVIKQADHIIDLGPEGGDGGGSLVAEGTPEEILKIKASHTGHALRDVLSKTRKP